MKRPTMKDIAEKAGVSTATVSYVLNYSEKQTISHEMRLKIFQIAKELNYVPNMNAKSLAKASVQNRTLGFVYEKKLLKSAASKYVFSLFFSQLQQELSAKGIEVIPLQVNNFIEDVQLIHDKYFDFLLVLNFNEETSEKFTSNFYIPILFFGGNVVFEIFRRLKIDYEAIFTAFLKDTQTEEQLLVIDSSVDKGVVSQAQALFKEGHVMDSSEDYFQYIKEKNIKAVLVLNEITALQLEREFAETQLTLYSLIHDSEQKLLRDSTKKILIDNKEVIKNIQDTMVFFTDWKSNIWEHNKKVIVPVFLS